MEISPTFQFAIAGTFAAVFCSVLWQELTTDWSKNFGKLLSAFVLFGIVAMSIRMGMLVGQIHNKEINTDRLSKEFSHQMKTTAQRMLDSECKEKDGEITTNFKVSGR